MAGISRSKFIPGLLVLLWVLLDCLCAVTCLLVPGDVHSVYYDFNISSHKQPWCMAQIQMDGKDIFSYDCGSDKVITVNLLREDVMATETWRQLTSMLKDIGNFFKQHLSDIKPEIYADRVPFTLQVRMTCQRNARGITSASWEFGWSGQRVLVFGLESGNYTVDHSGGEQLKEKWEKDKELTTYLTVMLKGDCNEWLQHLVSWKEEAETAGAPVTAPAAGTPSTVTVAPATTGWTPSDIISIGVPIGVLGVLLCFFFLRRFLRSNRRCCSEAPGCGLVHHMSLLGGCLSVSSCSPADLQELPSLQQKQRPPEDRDVIAMSLIA